MAKSCSSVKDRLGIRLGGASFMGSILYLNTHVNYNVTCWRCGARWRAMTGVPRPRRFCEDWGGMSGDLRGPRHQGSRIAPPLRNLGWRCARFSRDGVGKYPEA